jgi:hypothetical protein
MTIKKGRGYCGSPPRCRGKQDPQLMSRSYLENERLKPCHVIADGPLILALYMRDCVGRSMARPGASHQVALPRSNTSGTSVDRHEDRGEARRGASRVVTQPAAGHRRNVRPLWQHGPS